ncbi:MAG: TonB-dependent receptor plug domain-containing protein [Bacteroidia bacterium]
MKKSEVLFLCLGITIGVHAQVSGQSVSDSLSNLHDSIKTVTITATRTSKDVMEVGRDVAVITPDQIKNSSCNTLAELLSQQAGIFIAGTGQNPGSVQSLFLRGADNNHTTVMIDGVPISDPSNPNGALDLSELSLADVDKIEIIRGSHSTLYGSSAIGGVINIITDNKYTPGLHGNISVTGGEFGPGTNSLEESAFLNYTFQGGLYAEAGYHRFDDKGLSAATDTIKNPLPYQQTPKNNLDKGDFFSRAGYKNQNLSVYLEYRNTNQTFGLPEGAFQPANNYNGQLVRDFYTGFARYNLSPNLHIQYTGSYSPMERKYLQDTTVIDIYNDKEYQSQYYTSKTLTNDVQLDYDYKTSQFILGGGSNYETMNAGTDFVFDGFPYTSNLDSIKPSQTIYDVFAQADLNGSAFAPGLNAFSLLLGARLSSNSMFGNNISYELNPYYKVNPNTTLYLSYSTGFSAPSLYELYSPDKDGDSISTSVTLGNSKLTPETSGSFEVGLKRRVTNSLFFTLSWFETVVNNHIDYVYLWNKNRPFNTLTDSNYVGDTYLNLGQEITQGFELNILLKLSPKLDMAGNVSILSSILKYNPNNIDLSQTHGDWVQIFDGGEFLNGSSTSTGLLRRPGSLANFSLTWHPVEKLALTLRVRYVGTRSDAQYNYALGPDGAESFINVGDYTLLDAFASYDFTKHFSVMARGENLLNSTYYEILGYTTIGRSFYLNLRYAF